MGGMTPPPPAGGGGDEEAAGQPAEGAGFVVRIQARLLQGRVKHEAVGWLTERYYPALREISRTPGLGFYIPDDDPKDALKKSIRDPTLTRYHQVSSYGQPGLPPPTGVAGVQYPDPVTGEETATDWRVEFAFKVKLGEPPKEESKPESGESAPPAGH